MDGYLLVARMTIDDLPIRLFSTKEEMGEWLRAGKGTFEEVVSVASSLGDWPTSELLSISAIRFLGGVPIAFIHVMDV